ncbi:FMN-binding protein [uncultured Sphingomonas sp.]|uniref:FMN-binding protein n=1 Tax=uncultured Sphingomonas sp. TaxID=158754 RepID=UPI002620A935|nr:FMN-binding protein [uncultured Sphingomonas sp.]
MRRIALMALVPAAISSPGWAVTYMSVQQAQAAMFPGEQLTSAFHELTAQQVAAIRKASGESPLSKSLKSWRAADGGWFIADEVVGKHEFITYAVALSADGAVRGIEILDYRESYGNQVRDPRWRQQFVGKKAGQSLKLGTDIKNISGATLSSKHITDGVRRVLATYAIVLAHG